MFLPFRIYFIEIYRANKRSINHNMNLKTWQTASEMNIQIWVIMYIEFTELCTSGKIFAVRYHVPASCSKSAYQLMKFLWMFYNLSLFMCQYAISSCLKYMNYIERADYLLRSKNNFRQSCWYINKERQLFLIFFTLFTLCTIYVI